MKPKLPNIPGALGGMKQNDTSPLAGIPTSHMTPAPKKRDASTDKVSTKPTDPKK